MSKPKKIPCGYLGVSGYGGGVSRRGREKEIVSKVDG